MGKLIFVTGGARSGKSSFAEKLASESGDSVTYIATAIPFDEEMKERIARHKRQRPVSWTTWEGYKNIHQMIPTITSKVVLLDCVTIMITNLLLEEEIDWNNITGEIVNQVEKYIQEQVDFLIKGMFISESDFIIVSNEVGMGLVPEYPLGRIFRDIAGRVNQKFAQRADEVYFLVSGIPMKLK